MLSFANVVFVACGACDDVNNVRCTEGECAECGKCCFAVGV